MSIAIHYAHIACARNLVGNGVIGKCSCCMKLLHKLIAPNYTKINGPHKVGMVASLTHGVRPQ